MALTFGNPAPPIFGVTEMTDLKEFFCLNLMAVITALICLGILFGILWLCGARDFY